MSIKLSESQKIKILNSDDIFKVMQKILKRAGKIERGREHFWTVGLDNRNHILYIELISMGGSSATVVEPMQVFRVGVLKGAVKMILVHNHPSGELIPSEADKDITDRLVQVGNILQIYVADHLIISEKTYLSFEDSGLLDIIRKSTKYVPAYELEARMRKELSELALKKAEELAVEKAEKLAASRNKEIALGLLKSGVGIEIIISATGLSEEEIKRIIR